MKIKITYKQPIYLDVDSEVMEVSKIEKVENKIYFFETCNNDYFVYENEILSIEILSF